MIKVRFVKTFVKIVVFFISLMYILMVTFIVPLILSFM